MSRETPTRRKLTMDEIAAAKRLKAIWQSNKSRLGLNQTTLGERFRNKEGGPITQGAVGHYLNGVTPLNSWACREFARLLQTSVREFAPAKIIEELRVLSDKDDSSQYFKVHFYRPKYDTDGQVENVITLPLRWAADQDIDIDQVTAVECSDNDMEPRVHAGEIVLVRRDRSTIVSGKLYAIDFGNVVKIRRAYRKSHGTIVLIGDSRDSEPDFIRTGDLDRFVIVGEATQALVTLS